MDIGSLSPFAASRVSSTSLSICPLVNSFPRAPTSSKIELTVANADTLVQRGLGIQCGSALAKRVGIAREPNWIGGALQCAGAGVDVLHQGDSRKKIIQREGAARALASSDSPDPGFIRAKLAVFLSGGGSNFQALHTATLNNSIYGDVAVVISDKPGCKGCEFARENNLPVLSFPLSKHAQDGLSVLDLVAALRCAIKLGHKLENKNLHYQIDYVLLAGYLKMLPLELVQAYPQSILNIHPSLLPSFGGKGYYGMKVHEAVIKPGARFSGATVHFVDENFDTGPIVAQRIVPVLSDDTPQDLAAKVLKVEHLLYSEVVAALCEDRIFWRDDGVPLIRKSWNEAEYF